jgi:hypothetical protein
MDIAFTDEGAAEAVELKPEGVDDDNEVSCNDRGEVDDVGHAVVEVFFPRLPAQSCESMANLLLSIRKS